MIVAVKPVLGERSRGDNLEVGVCVRSLSTFTPPHAVLLYIQSHKVRTMACYTSLLTNLNPTSLVPSGRSYTQDTPHTKHFPRDRPQKLSLNDG